MQRNRRVFRLLSFSNSFEYAVFTAIGKIPDSIQATTKYIHRKWLPKSKYRHADSPEFELDDERSDNSENSEVDIYVPIVTS